MTHPTIPTVSTRQGLYYADDPALQGVPRRTRQEPYQFDNPVLEDAAQQYIRDWETGFCLESRAQALWRARAGRSVSSLHIALIVFGYVCLFLPGFLAAWAAWVLVRRDEQLCGERPRGYWTFWLLFWPPLALLVAALLAVVVSYGVAHGALAH